MVVHVDSPENLKRSVDTCIAALRGMKKIDLFECARIDPKYRIEDTLQVLIGFVKEGKFDHIGLSECSAETVRRANKVEALTRPQPFSILIRLLHIVHILGMAHCVGRDRDQSLLIRG